MVRVDSRYTAPGRDDTASVIDYFMLKRLPKQARTSVEGPLQGTEFLLSERLSLMGEYQGIDRLKWRELRRSAHFKA